MATLGLIVLAASAAAAADADPMAYWQVQRRGSNAFNNQPLAERFVAAKAFGLDYLRLAPNKWLNGRKPEQVGDFLLGPKGNYQGLVRDDVVELKRVLDMAHAADIEVVLTMLSLPGDRWSQHNGGKQERKLWNDFSFHRQSASMWRDLAKALAGHPAVVAYNIENEPSPERTGKRFHDWRTGDYRAWYQRVRGTPQDLNLFYSTVVKAIREVDSRTPILLDAGFHATPWAFTILEPVKDPRTLYSFHMYEPYPLVTKATQGSYRYPGVIPVGEGDEPVSMHWDRAALETFLEPVTAWSRRHRIAANRVLVGEFGMFRMHPDVEAFMRDQIEVYNERGWHWAFYSFREDDWHGMDYELGATKPGASYWKAVGARKMPDASVYRRKNAVASMLRSFLK